MRLALRDLNFRTENFNPRTPCGVRLRSKKELRALIRISIHAPRAGCDSHTAEQLQPHTEISIHAPRAGCDLSVYLLSILVHRFQSTHPVRGATQYPGMLCRQVSISIHAPRAGCDEQAFGEVEVKSDYFNPRTPCGVRPKQDEPFVNSVGISIHAPRAGCDYVFCNYVTNFLISIHAPRAGCDGKFDGFTRPNLRKRYKKVSVQPKKRAKKKIKEMLCSHSQMLCSHSHIFGWISGAKVPEFPAR